MTVSSKKTDIHKIILVALFTVLVVGSPAVPSDLSVTDRSDGAIGVQNEVYRVIIRPNRGAVISSLQFGSGAKMQATRWDKGTYSGLVMERITAGRQYEEVSRKTDDHQIRLTFSADAGHLSVKKTYYFQRQSGIIRVQLRFENTAEYALTGYDSPLITNLLQATERGQSSNSYYCMAQNGRPKVINASRALRELNRRRTRGQKCHWMAMTDPARQCGIGVMFVDSAHRCPYVSRNARGQRVINWSYGSIPPKSILRTSFLIIPFEGFSAVSEMNKRFLADTVVMEESEESVKMQFRFMPLRKAMKEVSIVSRAYDRTGKELQPCEPLMYDRIPARKVVSAEVELPANERTPAWLLYEVYEQGEKFGELLGKVRGGTDIPEITLRELPPPDITEKASGGGALREGESASQGEAFVLENASPGMFPPAAGRLELALLSGEKETVFWTIRARENISSLNISLQGTGDDERDNVQSLPPSACYTWIVRNRSDGGWSMDPYSKQELRKGERVWAAFTIDTEGLEAGVYRGELTITGAEQQVTTSLQVRISKIKLSRIARFGLWYSGVTPDSGVTDKLSSLGANGVVYRWAGSAHAQSFRSMIRDAHKQGYDQVAFTDPGMSVTRASEVDSVTDISMPSGVRGKPVWQLWGDIDSRELAELLQKKGFAIALLLDRASRLTVGDIWRGANPSFWMVENGCELGVVPGLIESGGISAKSSVWCAFDIRDASWKDVVIPARRAAWASAWQGVAGVVFSDEYRNGGNGRGRPVWHVLRDVRDEAAICAEMLRRAKALSEGSVENQAARLKRAEILTEVGGIIGRGTDCSLRVQQVRRGYRTVPRAVTSNPRRSVISGYRHAKTEAIELMEMMLSLVDQQGRAERSYRPARGVK